MANKAEAVYRLETEQLPSSTATNLQTHSEAHMCSTAGEKKPLWCSKPGDLNVSFEECGALMHLKNHMFIPNSFKTAQLCWVWNKTPNQDELKRRCLGCRAGTKWSIRRRKFEPLLPLIIMGNVRSLVDKMDESRGRRAEPWWGHSRTLRKGVGAAGADGKRGFNMQRTAAVYFNGGRNNNLTVMYELMFLMIHRDTLK